MGDLSNHFSLKEATCKCGCGQTVIDHNLVAILEDVRTHFNMATVVHSWNRCQAYNAKIGGAKDSQHLQGHAADIAVSRVHPNAVYAYLDKKYGNRIGLGLYSTFTHVDTRGMTPSAGARWRGNTDG